MVTPAEPLESERARLVEAERHQRLLSEISRLLLDYVGPDEVEPLRRIVDKVVEAMGDWVAFSLVQPDGTLKNVAAWHPDPAQRDLEQKLNALVKPQRWDAGPPEYNGFLQKKPIVIEKITDEMLKLSQPSEEALALYRKVGMTSVLAAPMFDAGEPLGQLVMVTTTPGGRRYSRNDLDFAFSLAGRAALAVRNARLLRQLSEERDRQKVERAESERRAAELLSVFDADPNGLALFDTQGNLQFASPKLEEIFGLPLRSMLGRHYDDIYKRKLQQVVSVDRERLFQRVQAIFNDRAGRTVDDLELEKPRHRFVTRNSVPVLMKSGEYLGRLFVYVDVTEQRELDRQRSDFLTVAAHELRTPLTPLSMYLQSIERKLQRGQAIEPELAGKARRQVGRLTRLVEDLLDVSRLESKRMALSRELLRVDELVEQVLSDFRGAAHNHELVFQRPHELLEVEGDRPRLEQVMVNLLQNAIKYSPTGGQVVVAVTRAGAEVRISVTDPGIGIPEEEQGRLFQRFFRARNVTTRHYGGLGIGLFVSHEIVARHGGRFEVRSKPGVGSTFTFFLPLAKSAELEAAETRARILLVDDDAEILEATSQVLREWGYAVDEARDGITALSLLRGARPDLMLVDLMMPGMDGWTLIERVRQEQVAQGVPIVVFSADRDTREKARSLKADAYLRKPFELEELQAVMERLVRQQPAA